MYSQVVSFTFSVAFSPFSIAEASPFPAFLFNYSFSLESRYIPQI